MICKQCGREFQASYIYTKYCSEECRKKAKREQARKQIAQLNASSAKAKTLTEWCKEAAECNLDYGNYRALIESGKTFDELKARAASRQLPTHSHLRAGRKYS